MKSADLTLYLVTDSTPAVLGTSDFYTVVEEALKGGVTLVQYRDKYADTRELISTAKNLQEITRRYGVPLLINDRVDVALAVGADGVHLGQDDMPLRNAREILSKNAIIGVTAASVEEARSAQQDGADYLGIGTIFATKTKENTKSVIGTAGAAAILEALEDFDLPSVAIGGITTYNVQRVLYQTSRSPKNALQGVAVVSAIVAADNPRAAATELKELIQNRHMAFYPAIPPSSVIVDQLSTLLQQVPYIVRKHSERNPLCHNMTNLVVQNFAANVCLATGSSPIMTTNSEEAPELAKLGAALVINMGTVTGSSLTSFCRSMQAYNKALQPVLFDPVGGGATSVRKSAIKTLMGAGFFDVIKGNEKEISAVLGKADITQRGVDSGQSDLTTQEKAQMVADLARREKNLILMTGAVDILSDGGRTVTILNGHPYLGEITGTGCALGAVIASYISAHRQDKFLAALAAILHYEIAAQRAACSDTVRGPATFQAVLLDELSLIKQESMSGQYTWCENVAKVEKIIVPAQKSIV